MTEVPHSILKGVSLKLLHVFLVTLMLAIIKSIKGMPITELMFFRSFFALVPLVLFLAWRRQLRAAVQTKRPFAHLTRAFLSVGTMGLTFVAVQALPLPEAVTLQYTQPLFVVALSALLLGERVRLFQWAAVGIGFSGALVITWPKLTLVTGGAALLSQTELFGVMAALTAAATFALNIMQIGQLVRTESSITISVWLGFYASVLLVCTIPFGWVMPTLGQLGLLVLAGLVGALLLISLSESLRHAPASITAPFEYASLAFSIMLGFIVFGDMPTLNMLAGSGILILAGMMIIWRERRSHSSRTGG